MMLDDMLSGLDSKLSSPNVTMRGLRSDSAVGAGVKVTFVGRCSFGGTAGEESRFFGAMSAIFSSSELSPTAVYDM